MNREQRSVNNATAWQNRRPHAVSVVSYLFRSSVGGFCRSVGNVVQARGGELLEGLTFSVGALTFLHPAKAKA